MYLICVHRGLYTIYLCINSGLLERVKITDTEGYLPVFMSIYLHLFHIHIHWNVLCYSGKSNQPTSVRSWLSSLDLDTQYLDKFNNMDFSTMARCQQIWEVELASVSFLIKYCSMTNIWDRTINDFIDAIFDWNHSNTIILTLIAYAGSPKIMLWDTRYCSAASLFVIVGIQKCRIQNF